MITEFLKGQCGYNKVVTGQMRLPISIGFEIGGETDWF
jgi:hypothetical protein